MRKPVLAVALAVALTVLGAIPAYAQPSGEPEPVPTATVEEPTPEPVDPVPTVEEPAPEPEPVDPPAPVDPGPVDPEPAVTFTPEPVETSTPATPVPPGPSEPAEPTPLPGTPTASPTASPTESASSSATPTSPTSAPPTSGSPVTNIDVDIEYDDRDDYSVHIEDNSTFIIEGDSYSNSYVYTDVDGRTVRAYDLDCSDFTTREEAQQVLDSSAVDIYWLDSDNDGRACETDLGEFTLDTANSVGVRRGGQVAVYPAGSVDTGRAW